MRAETIVPVNEIIATRRSPRSYDESAVITDQDLLGILEAAQVARYADWVDRSIALIVAIMSKAKTKEDLFAGVKKMTLLTHSSEFKGFLYERARTI